MVVLGHGALLALLGVRSHETRSDDAHVRSLCTRDNADESRGNGECKVKLAEGFL